MTNGKATTSSLRLAPFSPGLHAGRRGPSNTPLHFSRTCVSTIRDRPETQRLKTHSVGPGSSPGKNGRGVRVGVRNRTPCFSPTGEKWPAGPMRGGASAPRRILSLAPPCGAPLTPCALRAPGPLPGRGEAGYPRCEPLPSPWGEGARSADEGDSSRFHRDLPLTLTLSQGRGKACFFTKLIPTLHRHPIITAFPRHLRPGLVIRGRGEDGARPVGWS